MDARRSNGVGVIMKGLGAAAASAAVIILSGVGGAYAADLNTLPVKAIPPAAGPTTCTNIADFFTTACQLAAYGVRFYGTIDVGYGYQTNGASFDSRTQPTGLTYFNQKMNGGARWSVAPNAMGT
jgi:hypothetical protein